MFLKDVKDFYVTLVDKLLHYLPVGNHKQAKLLRSPSFLDPSTRANSFFEENAVSVAKVMKTVITEDVASVAAEARMLRIYDRINTFDCTLSETRNIVGFWLSMSNLESYRTLSKLALSSLCLPHGNADTERLLKLLTSNLTNERNCLQEEMLHAMLVLKSGLASRDWSAETFPIDDSLIKRGFEARCNYHKKLEQQRKECKAEEEKKKKELQAAEAAKAAKHSLASLLQTVVEQESQLQELMQTAAEKRKEAMHLLSSAKKDKQAIAKKQEILQKERQNLLSPQIPQSGGPSCQSLSSNKCTSTSMVSTVVQGMDSKSKD